MLNEDYLNKLHTELLTIMDEFDRICNKYNLTYFLAGGSLLGAVRHKGFIPWDDDLDVTMPREDFDKLIKYCYKDLKDSFYLDFYTNNKNYFKPYAKLKKQGTIFIESNSINVKEKQEIWIDIFPLDYTEDDLLLEKQKFWKDKIHHIVLTKVNAKVELCYIKKLFVKIAFSFISNNRLCKIQQNIMKIQNNKTDRKYYVNLGSQYGIIKQKHLIENYYPIQTMKFENKIYNVPNDYNYVLKMIYGENYMQIPPEEKRCTHYPIMVMFSDGEKIEF